MLRPTRIALAFAAIWGLLPGQSSAQQSPQQSQQPQQDTGRAATRLKEITVTSTRTEREVDDVPNTVTVIQKDEIEQSGSRDIKDLFSQEADISVRQSATRFSAAGSSTGRAGIEGINIRGLEGNQILIMSDGIRTPASFSFGAFATGRGDFTDLETLKTVEILRGPSSTQYGSDGLAGAVSFQTLDPADLIQAQQASGGFLRTAYNSLDRSWIATIAAAARTNQWQSMLLISQRKGHETDNQGNNNSLNANRTSPNPLDYDNSSILAKLYLLADAKNRFGVIAESKKQNQQTEVYSARSVPPFSPTSVVATHADDRSERQRVSLEHRFQDSAGRWLQRSDSKIYWQNAETRQYSVEDRYSAADRTRNNTYQTRLIGLSTQAESQLDGMQKQRLSYGFEWSRASISGVRDGTTPPYGEQFPAKPFPDTDYTLAGAFIQSEIEADALSIIPALRYDYYKLKPSSTGYSGAVVSLSDQAITPRIGLIWRATPALAPYLQWSGGFRAPAPDQVNNGFTNIAVGYGTIGNANLKAERANTVEIGLRAQLDQLRLTLTRFDSRYRDFISLESLGGSGRPGDPILFQSINLDSARIRGNEARLNWDINPNWKLNAAIAYARGDSNNRGVRSPIDTVNPLKTVVGLRYRGNDWGLRSDLTHSSAKSADQVNPLSDQRGNLTAQYTPSSYTVWDLGADWTVMPGLSLNLNLNNVLDTKYWVWSDVRGLAANSNVIDAYSAAGRNLRVSLRYTF